MSPLLLLQGNSPALEGYCIVSSWQGLVINCSCSCPLRPLGTLEARAVLTQLRELKQHFLRKQCLDSQSTHKVIEPDPKGKVGNTARPFPASIALCDHSSPSIFLLSLASRIPGISVSLASTSPASAVLFLSQRTLAEMAGKAKGRLTLPQMTNLLVTRVARRVGYK